MTPHTEPAHTFPSFAAKSAPTFRCTVCGNTLPWSSLDEELTMAYGEPIGLECVEFIHDANERLGGIV